MCSFVISEEAIQDLRERTDIVAVIGDYVRLKKRGANHLGLCPFHNEKTPSFNVHPGRHFFHCFGCKASGDAITFLMRIEGLSFPQAARALAERAGIVLPELDRQESTAELQQRKRRERLCAVMEAATAFYVECLQKEPAAHNAREELHQRGIHPETAALFRLGYAPAAWDGLAKALQAQGHALEDAEALGLVSRRRDGNGYFDRFRNRLQFPVADVSGQVVAFSGRILPEVAGHQERADQAKYINSPEGPLYRKGQVLFGLHQARIALRRMGWGVLCEGNFDLVALRQAGFENVVAPLGTAFTAMQASLLGRYVERVTLLFDGDAAGQKAVTAAHPLLVDAGLSARVASLPPGEDPDSYLRARGKEALQALVDEAPGLVEHLIDRAAADSLGQGGAVRAAALASLAPIVASVKNPVEIDLYVQRVARAFQVSDVTAVRRQLRESMLKSRKVRGPQSSAPKVADRRDRVNLPNLEADLCGVLLDQPQLFFSDEAKKLEELLTSPELRGMFRTAAELFQEHGALDAPTLLSRHADLRHDEDGFGAYLRERLAVARYQDRSEAQLVLARGVVMLEKQMIEKEQQHLLRKIQEARREGNEVLAIELTRQRNALFSTAKRFMGHAKG